MSYLTRSHSRKNTGNNSFERPVDRVLDQSLKHSFDRPLNHSMDQSFERTSDIDLEGFLTHTSAPSLYLPDEKENSLTSKEDKPSISNTPSIDSNIPLTAHESEESTVPNTLNDKNLVFNEHSLEETFQEFLNKTNQSLQDSFPIVADTFDSMLEILHETKACSDDIVNETNNLKKRKGNILQTIDKFSKRAMVAISK